MLVTALSDRRHLVEERCDWEPEPPKRIGSQPGMAAMTVEGVRQHRALRHLEVEPVEVPENLEGFREVSQPGVLRFRGREMVAEDLVEIVEEATHKG